MKRTQRRHDGRWPRWAAPAYAGLFALGVPWYWPANTGQALLAGVPIWAVASLACSVATSTLTAYLVLRHWPAGEEGDGDGV